MGLLFRWRRAVVGPTGPESPVTRHVVLTLSLHMDEHGGSCFPSVRTLAAETGLARRTVQPHLADAEEDGWIRRIERSGTGQGWRRMEYEATLPPNVVQEVPHVEVEGGEAGSPRRAEGGESHGMKVGKEVPLSTSMSTPTTTAIEGFCELTGSHWRLKSSIDDWAVTLEGDFPHIPVQQMAREIRQAGEWHQGKSKKPKPDQAIRNWLKRVEPSGNGSELPANYVRPEDLE